MRFIRRSAPRAAAALAVGGAAAFALAGSRPAAGERVSSTFRTGAFALSNSDDGSAIFSAVNMRPGDSATGTVGIANNGDAPAAMILSSAVDSSQPGRGGGTLGSVLDLTVTDLTSGANVYSGAFGALATKPLGIFAAGESHSYRFTVTFPSQGAADNAAAGASTTVRYTWTGTSDVGGGDTDTSTIGTTIVPPTTTTPPPQPPTGGGSGGSGSGTGSGSGGGGATGDTTAPRLVLGGPARQGLRRPYVTARCNEPCVLYPTARVSGVKGLKKLRVIAPAKATGAGQTVRLTVVPGSGAAKMIARAVAAGKRVQIRISVAADDLAENESTSARSVTLRR